MGKSILRRCFVYLLLLYMLVAVVLPMAKMVSTIAGTDVVKILSGKTFIKALNNSLTVSCWATLISVALGGMLAFCLSRAKVPGRSAFIVLFTLPMLIPSISHGMGLIILLGQNGVITNLLHLRSGIYGLSGLIAGSVLYSYPVAFLMIYDILRYEDGLPYEAANVLGIPKTSQFFSITLPYMVKPMISVFFCVFTMIITDYGVPLTIGGKLATLPVIMYKDVIGLLDFGKGSLIGVILLIPAFIAFVLDVMNREKSRSSFITKPVSIRRQPVRDALCTAFACVIAFCVLLPIAAFCVISFIKNYPMDMTFSLTHVARAVDMGAGQYLCNSIIISLGVALLGVALTTLGAYYTVRIPSPASKLLHLLSILTLAIPGLVLGLSYSLYFSGGWLYGTLAILIMVNSIHFYASPYLMIYNTFGKLNQNLETVGLTLGISRASIFFRVLLPQTASTLLEMASYFFVNCMMTISAVSFLATVATKPVSLMINQFEAQMMLECSALVSVVILLVNLLIKLLINLLRKALTLKGVADQ